MVYQKICIKRAPVLTLWAAQIAERLVFDSTTALTLGPAARMICSATGRDNRRSRMAISPDWPHGVGGKQAKAAGGAAWGWRKAVVSH